MRKELNRNPWVGPQSYPITKSGNSSFSFCGRSDDIFNFTRLIRENNIVTLYGRSGVGKTSLLNAGIYPRLTAERFLPIILRLGQKDKGKSIQYYIKDYLERIESDLQCSSRINESFPDETDESFLCKLLCSFRFKSKEQELCPLLIFDQFEELLRWRYDETKILLQQIDYLTSNLQWIPNRPNFRFVITIREDDLYLLEDCLDNCYLYSFKNCRYRLRPLDYKNAEEVITIPGEEYLPTNEEREELIKKIIQLSTNSEDGAISTITLSIVCSMLYDDMISAGQKRLSLKNYIDDKGELIKDDLFEKYYDDATKDLKQRDRVREFIEDKLVMSERRVAVPKKYAIDKIDKEDINQLIHSSKKLLNETSDERIELIHDAFCPVLAKKKVKRELEKEKSLREEEQKERNRLYEIQSLFLAEKINSLVADGDSYKAQLLALEALPKDIEKPDRPIVNEAVESFRKAVGCDTIIIHTPYTGWKINRYHISFVEDGRYIISNENDIIQCWNVYTGELLKSYRIKNYSSLGRNCSSVSLDGSLCAFNNFNNIFILEIPSFEDKLSISIEGEVFDLVFSSDSRRLAIVTCVGGAEPQIKIIVYDFDKEEIHDIWNNNRVGLCPKIKISPNFNYIAILRNKTFGVKKINNDSIFTCKLSSLPVKQFVFSPNEKYVAILANDIIYMLDIENKKVTQLYNRNRNNNTVPFKIGPLVFSEDSSHIGFYADGILKIIDIEKRKETIINEKGLLLSMSFNRDNSQIAYILREKIVIKRIVPVESDVSPFYNYDNSWQKIKISNDLRFSACVQINKDTIVNDSKSKSTYEIKSDKRIVSVDFSPFGDYLLTATEDGYIRTWNLNDKSFSNSFIECHDRVIIVSYSNDGKYAVSISKDGMVIIWDIKSTSSVSSFRINEKVNELYSIKLFSDNKRMLIANRTSIYIWDVEQKEIIVSMKDVSICNAVLSPDEKFVVTIGDNGPINIWSISTCKKVDNIEVKYYEPVKTMLFSDKQLVVYTTTNVYKYSLLQYLMDEVRNRFTKVNLSDEDIKKYYLYLSHRPKENE